MVFFLILSIIRLFPLKDHQGTSPEQGRGSSRPLGRVYILTKAKMPRLQVIIRHDCPSIDHRALKTKLSIVTS